MKIECPNCKQDWVHIVSHPSLSQNAFWCPEDESLWFTLENLLSKEQMFGVTFTRGRSFETLIGQDNFDAAFVDEGIYEGVSI